MKKNKKKKKKKEKKTGDSLLEMSNLFLAKNRYH